MAPPAARPPLTPSTRPKRLRPGDCIAVTAPAGPVPADALNHALSTLRKAGFRVFSGPLTGPAQGYLAAADAERAENLIAALRCPEAAAVWCTRGGYGSSRILQHLPFSTLRRSPKIFLGFSDITFLHAALHRQAGWVTFHGPNLVQAAAHPARFQSLIEVLTGRRPLHWQLTTEQVLRPGAALGPVLGGNLTCLVHLIGTPFFPDLDGRILLLEDRGEACYRLDRRINHLKMVGAFDHLAGLVLGRFTDCGRREEVLEMIERHLRAFSFPIVFDLPFGHEEPNDVIAFGHPFRLDTQELCLDALESPFDDRD